MTDQALLTDYLRAAHEALERAREQLRYDIQPARDAIQHEIGTAINCVDRVLHLIGG